MNDKDFLLWVADRLVKQHGDFVSKLCSIAESLPSDRYTPNTVTYKEP